MTFFTKNLYKVELTLEVEADSSANFLAKMAEMISELTKNNKDIICVDKIEVLEVTEAIERRI